MISYHTILGDKSPSFFFKEAKLPENSSTTILPGITKSLLDAEQSAPPQHPDKKWGRYDTTPIDANITYLSHSSTSFSRFSPRATLYREGESRESVNDQATRALSSANDEDK